jgi:hypothetical protein
MNGDGRKRGREEKSSTFCKSVIHSVKDFSLVPRIEMTIFIYRYTS